MRLLRVALRVSLGLVALGFVGGLAAIASLTVMCPAGCPQLTTPPAPILVAAGAFVVGSVGAVVFSGLIAGRQSANPAQPQPPVAHSRFDSAPDQTMSTARGVSAATFRPMGLGLRRGAIPTSSSLPWAQHFMIDSDGLEVRNLFDRAWIPRDRITGPYSMPAAIRVIWDDGDCTATITDLFRTKKIRAAMERAGYRFAAD